MTQISHITATYWPSTWRVKFRTSFALWKTLYWPELVMLTFGMMRHKLPEYSWKWLSKSGSFLHIPLSQKYCPHNLSWWYVISWSFLSSEETFKTGRVTVAPWGTVFTVVGTLELVQLTSRRNSVTEKVKNIYYFKQTFKFFLSFFILNPFY